MERQERQADRHTDTDQEINRQIDLTDRMTEIDR